jgi:hypothetical protein
LTGNALGDPDFASVTKQKEQKIDSVFIMFHPDEACKAICIQLYIEKFRVTSEDSRHQTYPGGGLFIMIWNDPI